MTVNAWGSAVPVPVAKGGTGRASPTDASIMLGDGTSAVELVGPLSKGDLLVGTTGGSPQLLTVGSNGQVLSCNSSEATGLEWVTAGGSSGPASGDLKQLLIYDDFLGYESEFDSSQMIYLGGDVTEDHVGVWITSTGSPRYLKTTDDVFFVDGGAMVCECTAKPSNSLVTGSNYIIIGYRDAGATDGIYFRYSPADGDTNWFAVTEASGTATETDSSVTPAVDTWVNFRIEVNAGGTSVVFKLDGSTVATHTTNIPSSSTGMTGQVYVVGSSTNELHVDALMYDKVFDGDRA